MTDLRRTSQICGALAVLILLASWLAARIQSDGGAVDVRALILPTADGQWLAADLFKPRRATRETPAPLVIVVPGFQRTKETLRNVAIELSRRGVVSIVIDPYAQGDSSASMQRQSATKEGYGTFALVDYVHDTDNLNYIDKTRIAVTGHSAGGNAAIRAASHYGRIAKRRGEPSKLHAVFVSGYLLTMTDRVLRHVRSNVGVSYALYDEGAYRNEHGRVRPAGAGKWAAADLRHAPEARRVVASGIGAAATPSELAIGTYYGDVDQRTLRVLHNERLLHPFQPYSFEATSNQLDFFARVFQLEDLPSDDQVWHYKELLTFASLLAAFASLLPLARLLLAAPWWRPLVHAVPDAPAPPRGRACIVFWIVFALSGGIAAISYVPLCEWSQQLFLAASSRQQTWFFPQRMNNAVMLWALLNGLVGLLLFAIARRLNRTADQDAPPATLGATTNASEWLRASTLAVTLFAAFFGYLAVMQWLFHVDYRFVFLGVRTFRPAVLALLPMYLPCFFVFFITNSLRVNAGMRFPGTSRWRNLLLACVANTFGLALILLLQYGCFAATGTVFWTDSWLYVNLLFAVVPIMFLLPIFHRLFFEMTGRIYLGPMTTSLVFVTIMLSNTVCYIPL